MTTDTRVLVHRDKQALTDAVAARFITKVIDLLDDQAEVHLVLTGGGVGTGVLAAVNSSGARDSIDWSRVHAWWGDERWLPRGDVERNETGAREALLDHVSIRPENIHAFAASDEGLDLDAAADDYARRLADAAPEGADVPVFDITFLGVGPDGHVASLFPDSPGIREIDATVLAVRNSPKPPPERLSLSLTALNTSDRIWMSLAGADKASALGLALAGAGPVEVPVAGVHGLKRTVFFIDADAAAHVPDNLIASEY